MLQSSVCCQDQIGLFLFHTITFPFCVQVDQSFVVVTLPGFEPLHRFSTYALIISNTISSLFLSRLGFSDSAPLPFARRCPAACGEKAGSCEAEGCCGHG